MKRAPFENTPNIEWKNGAWRYRVPKHQLPIYEVNWYRIGTAITDVYTFLSELSKRDAAKGVFIDTVGKALDKYMAEVLPLKAFATRRINMISIARIRVAFGKSHPLSVKTPDIFDYKHVVGEAHGEKSANNDIEVISHLYSKMIEWGTIENHQHPIRGQRVKFSIADRDRYVEHWEIVEAMKVANPMLEVYIPFKLKTGLDKSTILRIELERDVTEDGIHYTRRKLNRHDSAKKPKRKLIPWDAELRSLHAAALSLHKRPSRTLFATRAGDPYIDEDGVTEGFNSVWQRFMTRVLTKTKVTERFTEHDLRAKNASDEKDERIASKRMDHSNQGTTNKVYRRKAEISQSLELRGIGLTGLINRVTEAQTERDTKLKKGYKAKT